MLYQSLKSLKIKAPHPHSVFLQQKNEHFPINILQIGFKTCHKTSLSRSCLSVAPPGWWVWAVDGDGGEKLTLPSKEMIYILSLLLHRYLYIIYVYGCFLKWWYPPNTPKWSFLVGKPIVVGYQHLREPPYKKVNTINMLYLKLNALIETQTKTEIWNCTDSPNYENNHNVEHRIIGICTILQTNTNNHQVEHGKILIGLALLQCERLNA